MSDREPDRLSEPGSHRLDEPTAVLLAASWVYGLGRSIHRGFYDRGFRERGKLDAPVICVGNLTVGGTGKTPFLIELTHQLRSRGWNPAILSRGYGSQPPAKEPRIVSDGTHFMADVERSGDEPYLIARSCPGTPVLIGAKRFESGKLAEKEFSPDCFILDDGFQHEALDREVDLVLWDVRDDPSRLHLLPAGRLREPLSALNRASSLILTHADALEERLVEPRLSMLKSSLGQYLRSGVPVFQMKSRLSGYRPVGGDADKELRPIEELAGEGVLLVSGLARPEGFERMVRNSGLEVLGHRQLPDHASYRGDQIQEFIDQAGSLGATRILTTAKDAVKLEPLTDNPVFYVVELNIEIEETQRWSEFLDGFAPQRNPKEA